MKPRYYIAINANNHLTLDAPQTLAECVRAVTTYQAAIASEEVKDGCVFVLIARGSTIEFLHADRFLAGVAAGDISGVTSLQADGPPPPGDGCGDAPVHADTDC